MADDLRFGLRLPQEITDFSELRDLAQAAEDLGFHSLWLYDHFFHFPTPDNLSVLEPWTLMSVIAGATRRIRVGGLDAVAVEFEAPRQQGTPLVGRALFVAHEGRVFEILGIAVQERWRAVERTIGAALESFAPMTERAFLEAEPQRIEIVRLPSDMSFTEFERRYPSDVAGDVLRLLNRISDPTAVIGAGTPLKRVVGRRFGDG